MTDESPTAPGGDSGRDSHGRFAKGNAGGPGNPHARQAAQLRRAALDAVAPEHIGAIIRRLTRKSLEGDMKATRLLFDRVLGRPGEEAQEPAAIELDLPRLTSADDCAAATEAIIAALCAGKLTQENARLLLDAVGMRVRAIEAAEFEHRLADVEQQLSERTGKKRRT